MDFEPNWSETTAIIGGTFDPPHIGHLQLVKGLLEKPGIGHIIILPAGDPPLKSGSTDVKIRREMVEIAFKELDSNKVSIDFSEMDFSEHHPGEKTYTIDSLDRLSKKHSELAFVCGIDQFSKLPKWKGFPEIMNKCHWVIVERKPHKKEKAIRLLQEFEKQNWLVSVDTTFKLVTTPADEISSTDIRKGKIKDTGIPEINEFMDSRGLYQG